MSLRNLETPAEKELRRLVTSAHERELSHHLESVEADLAAWRAGKLSAVQVTDRIRAFQEGPVRALAKRYVPSNTVTALGHAVLDGAVTEAEVPAELRDELAVVISVLKFKR